MSVKLRAIVVATLVTMPVACGLVVRDFDVEIVFDAGDLARIAEQPGREPEDLSKCNILCFEALRELRGKQRAIESLDSCTLEPLQGDAVRVRCSGRDAPLME